MKKADFVFLFLFFILYILFSENGYHLWLRYDPVSCKQKQLIYDKIFIKTHSLIGWAIREELEMAYLNIKNKKPDFLTSINRDNLLVIATLKSLPKLDKEVLNEIEKLNEEGYIIREIIINKKGCLLITSKTEVGLLYGTFHLLRLWQMGEIPERINITSSPKIQYRVLNHWDNLDGSIERGYAGRSLWYGKGQIDTIRLKDYARANASIGINTVVLNNVNASPVVLSDSNLKFVAKIANIFRRYGIRIMLSINFSSPKNLGGLPNSDPLNNLVVDWWKNKIDEIYSIIPDFAGFLVKANSEGLPGPQDFGRTHADGANMLAKLLKPYNGILVWRAFVYSPTSEDRAKQGFNEFYPLDGKFLNNVVIQVKNGPIDFQPREPFHPLFGAMKKTNVGLELQITQEYLGFSTHLVFLAPQYKEILESDTYSKGKGSTLSRVIDGSLYGNSITLIAGVANTGDSKNWCGHHFAQANWYTFGRIAWDYNLSNENIAREWIKLTFSNNDSAISIISEMMLISYEAAVNYMTPMGLHHLMGYDHHYGPQPWLDTAARPDWNSVYYHRADSIGLGFDRSSKGSNAVTQYFSPLDSIFNNIHTCPIKYLLWFHHIPWNYKLSTGNTLWAELCIKYDEGVKKVLQMHSLWQKARSFIDEDRYFHVEKKIKQQLIDARWWKEACLLYFQSFSRMPFPATIEPIQQTLDYYLQLKVNPPIKPCD